MFALDANTGAKLWSYKISQANGKILSTPTLGSDGTLYVLSNKGYLAALDPAGNERWVSASDGGGDYVLAPIVAGGFVCHCR